MVKDGNDDDLVVDDSVDDLVVDYFFRVDNMQRLSVVGRDQQQRPKHVTIGRFFHRSPAQSAGQRLVLAWCRWPVCGE